MTVTPLVVIGLILSGIVVKVMMGGTGTRRRKREKESVITSV